MHCIDNLEDGRHLAGQTMVSRYFLRADSDGVHVTFEGSDNAARSAPQQQADELPSTRQASGQTPWHARIKPQVAPSAEQQSQSPPDVTGV